MNEGYSSLSHSNPSEVRTEDPVQHGRSRFSPLSLLARRFIAGETIDEAVHVARDLNHQGLRVTLDLLGENVRERESALEAKERYRALLEAIDAGGLDASISVKLTQLGLDIDDSFCRENLASLVEEASRKGNFLEVDMEGSAYTQRTIDLFHAVYPQNGILLLCIQAYLYRSEADIQRLNSLGARVRLCKGAYKEPKEIAFADRHEVRRNFEQLMQRLFSEGKRPVIATHNEALIEKGKTYAARCGLEAGDFEFQMLYGVRRDLQRKLASEGHDVRIYVPFGTEWFSYFWRRLRERKENMFFLLKNIFRG